MTALSRAGAQSAALLRALQAAAPEPLGAMALARVLWPDGRLPAEPLRAVQVAVRRLRVELERLGASVTVGKAAADGRYALVRMGGAGVAE